MNNEIKFLTPFKRMCMTIGTLPSSFYASMSYYESMVWLYEYLKNEVIPVVNNNSEVAQELQTAFTELENYIEHYFENLDIQEEINTKLDEMAEDGTLADMIAEYIKMQGQLVYNTVADMKSADNIQNGSFLKTYGYHSYKDGGGALYKARTITNEDVIDDMTIIALNDVTLVAEFIPENDAVNIKQFGAYGDGTHEDYNAINKAINDFDKIIIPNGRFLVSTSLNLSEKLGKHIIGNTNVSHGSSTTEKSVILGNTGDNPIFNLLGARNITFEDLTIVSVESTSNPSTLGILQGTTQNVQYSQWINLYNVTIMLETNATAHSNMGSIGIYNYQSELNNYNNVYIYADVPAIILNDDDFGIATSFGAIRSEHDSLSHNTYTHLMLHSKKTVAMYLSGTDLYFTGLYCQQGIVLRPQQTHSNQNVNINMEGLIEEATTPFTFENSPILQESCIKMQCVRAETLIGGTGVIVRSDVMLTSDSATVFSDTNIRINLSSITKRGGLEIKNTNCQGNIIKGVGLTKIPSNNNFGVTDDGTLLIDGKALILSNAKPTRTDLPDKSIAICTAHSNILGWRYSSGSTTWNPYIVGNVIQTVSSQIANQTASIIGQLATDINTHEFYIAYDTTQGAFRKITTTSI